MRWMLTALVVLACMVPMAGVLACSTHAEQAIATVTNFFGGTAVPGGSDPGHQILVTGADGSTTILSYSDGGSGIMSWLQSHSTPPPVDVYQTRDEERNA